MHVKEKPVVFEAWQWNPFNEREATDIIAILRGRGLSVHVRDVNRDSIMFWKKNSYHLVEHVVLSGGWIVGNPASGEYSGMSDEMFKARYELA